MYKRKRVGGREGAVRNKRRRKSLGTPFSQMGDEFYRMLTNDRRTQNARNLTAGMRMLLGRRKRKSQRRTLKAARRGRPGRAWKGKASSRRPRRSRGSRRKSSRALSATKIARMLASPERVSLRGHWRMTSYGNMQAVYDFPVCFGYYNTATRHQYQVDSGVGGILGQVYHGNGLALPDLLAGVNNVANVTSKFSMSGKIKMHLSNPGNVHCKVTMYHLIWAKDHAYNVNTFAAETVNAESLWKYQATQFGAGDIPTNIGAQPFKQGGKFREYFQCKKKYAFDMDAGQVRTMSFNVGQKKMLQRNKWERGMGSSSDSLQHIAGVTHSFLFIIHGQVVNHTVLDGVETWKDCQISAAALNCVWEGQFVFKTILDNNISDQIHAPTHSDHVLSTILAPNVMNDEGGVGAAVTTL